MTPEQHLWIAVLSQAIADATNPSDAEEFRRARLEAHRWFKYGRKDYQMICALAGIDHEALREHYLNGTLTHIKRNDRATRVTG